MLKTYQTSYQKAPPWGGQKLLVGTQSDPRAPQGDSMVPDGAQVITICSKNCAKIVPKQPQTRLETGSRERTDFGTRK